MAALSVIHIFTSLLIFEKQVLNQTPMFTNVMGGYNVKERLRCIEELKSFDSAGYVIDGFHSNGVSAANMNWEEVEPVLKSTLVFLLYNIYIARYLPYKYLFSQSALPDHRPRVFHGAVTPLVLIKLAASGIDIFDATFPWLVTERGGALIFPNSLLPPTGYNVFYFFHSGIFINLIIKFY